MGDLDYNQFQPNNGTNNTSTALQRTNVARQYQAVSNEKAHERHHSSTYTDDEKRWLVIAEEEERRRGKGFMDRLKKTWDEFQRNACVFRGKKKCRFHAQLKQILSILNSKLSAKNRNVSTFFYKIRTSTIGI